MQTGPHITRQKFVMILVVLLWITMALKIGGIQFIDHSHLYKSALNQRIKTVTLTGSRGNIFDCNGVQLAMNLESASYGIRYKEIENVDVAVAPLSEATGMSALKIKTMIASKKNFQWLIRQADNSVIEKLDNLNLKGVEKKPVLKRYYPLGKIAAQVIGYTDIDEKGIDGCEYFLNDELSGRNGRSTVLWDKNLKKTPSLDEPIIEPRNGHDIVLTLDWRIQEIAEEELEEGVAKANARSGGVIVLDTGTGEILAMANVPRFDPNDKAYFDNGNFDPQYRKNRLTTDMIEPGSTFKIVAFIEALESGVISEDDIIDCENGIYKIGRHTINDYHKLGSVPARDVLIHSSNIGTVKIAEKIGKQKLYERARLLGFGEITGFDFPDETLGSLPDPRIWSKLSLPTISFGQGVAVSPVQLSMAYAAVANGGFLLSPRIIKEIRSNDGKPDKKTEKKIIRQVMTDRTAERIIELLCRAVEEGTGFKAAIPNVRIAGKTGTAQRVKEGVKGYTPGLYISSFIGFIADRDPKILCFVMVDSPRGVYYGSQVAAPIFKNIMNRILNIGNSPWAEMIAEKERQEPSNIAIVPDMKGATVKESVAKLAGIGFQPVVIGDSTLVVKQFPLAGAELNRGSAVTLYGNIVSRANYNSIKIPDLKGKTMREAVQYLVQSNLGVNIEGSGIVKSQDPAAGSLVNYGTVCTIACNKR